MKALIKRFILINMCKSLYKTTTRLSNVFFFSFFTFHMCWSISFHGKWDGFFRVGLNSASRLFEISSASCFFFKLCGRREESVPDLSPTLFRNGLRYIYTHTTLYSDGANALEHGVTFSLRAKLFFLFLSAK